MLILVVVACGFLAIAVGYATDKYTRLLDTITYQAKVSARKNLGHDLISRSYWMSESKEAMEIMKVLGKNINNHYDGIFEISNVRDEWRSAVKNEKEN